MGKDGIKVGFGSTGEIIGGAGRSPLLCVKFKSCLTSLSAQIWPNLDRCSALMRTSYMSVDPAPSKHDPAHYECFQITLVRVKTIDTI